MENPDTPNDQPKSQSTQSSKFDHSYNVPTEWGQIPFRIMVGYLTNTIIEGHAAIPTSYGRTREWNLFTVKQKEKICTSWSQLPEETRANLLVQAEKVSDLTGAASIDLSSNDNWNLDDWARLIHLFADPALSALWTESVTQLDDQNGIMQEDDFEIIATHFNDYTGRIYANATYLFTNDGKRVCIPGKTMAFKLLRIVNPTNATHTPRNGSDIKEKMSKLKIDFVVAHTLFQRKTGDGGERDQEAYFYSKCDGDAKLLYAYHVWSFNHINMLGKIREICDSSDSGVQCDPNSAILSTPRGKKTRLNSHVTTPNPGPAGLIDLTSRDILQTNEILQMSLSATIHLSMYGNEEQKKQANAQLDQLAFHNPIMNDVLKSKKRKVTTPTPTELDTDARLADVFLGLDIGTQSVKAVFCESFNLGDESRVILTGQSGPLEVTQGANGQAEQNPQIWIRAIKEAIENALSHDSDGVVCRLRAIGVSGQQHGMVAVDKDGDIIRPCMLWCDTRAVEEAERISTYAGRHIPPGFTAPKIMWYLKHEPQNYHRTAKFMLPHDYVNYILSGKRIFAMECGDASGIGILDYTTRQLDRNLLDFIDLSLHTKFPPSLSSAHLSLGTVDPLVADLLGLGSASYPILIAPGCGDNAMTVLGISSLVDSQASVSSHRRPLFLSLGTSGTLMYSSPTPIVDPTGVIAGFADATGQWLPLVCVQNCSMVPEEILSGASLRTQSQQEYHMGLTRDQLTDAARNVPIGCDGVTILPYFSSGGERTPNWPHSSGAILGLRHGYLNNPALLYRAAIEAVTFALWRGYQRMSELSTSPESVCNEICVVGGGAQNPLWRQVIADVFGMVVRSPNPKYVGHAAAIGGAAQAIAVCYSLHVGSVKILSISPLSSEAECTPNKSEETKQAYAAAYRRHVSLGNVLFSNE